MPKFVASERRRRHPGKLTVLVGAAMLAIVFFFLSAPSEEPPPKKKPPPPPPDVGFDSDVDMGDGWQTIQVYIGKTKAQAYRFDDPNSIYHSQARQDRVVLTLLSPAGFDQIKIDASPDDAAASQKNRFFVDLAANDATWFSNTYTLERYFNWTGLCYEPNPSYWYGHSVFRHRCQTIGAVISGNKLDDKPGGPVQFRFNNAGLGGIVGPDFDNKDTTPDGTVMQHTVSFASTLKKFNAPKIIDYLSLDVEGAEGMVIDDDFPFGEFKFKIITIERPKEDLIERLAKHGYKKFGNLADFGEKIWYHGSFEGELNLDAARVFLLKDD